METRFMKADAQPVERLDLRGNISLHHPKGQLQSQKVQFETPFPLWCSTCPIPTIIGERTKFTADKARVQSPNSKPTYSYRIRHVNCGGNIEIRTTGAGGYEVVEGARKKTAKDGVVTEEDFEILTTAELADRKQKAFALLEYQAEEAEKEKSINQRTLDLYEASKQFEYPFMPKKEAEAMRVSREQAFRPQSELEPYLLEAPPMDRAQHMKEIDDIMRRQKRAIEKRVHTDDAKLKQANKAFVTSVRRNTRRKLDPFRNASNDFGRSSEPRPKRKRRIEGLQPRDAGNLP